MATLHVRNLPDVLYQRIQEQAAAENRSLSAQVIMLLHSAVNSVQHRRLQGQLLDEIRRRRFVPPKDAPDTTTMLREDRER